MKRYFTIASFLLAAIVACFMTACTTTLPSKAAPLNQKMTWNARQKELSTIKTWQIQGGLAIHTTTQAESAFISWQQQAKTYQLHVFGPLGVASTTIHGQPGKVILILPNQKTRSATTPENLLEQQLGWKLPVSNLYYWIRGLPVPNRPAIKTFDIYHHITKLEQNGWKINYLQYTGVSGQDLPSKIFLTYPGLSLRIIINHWEIR